MKGEGMGTNGKGRSRVDWEEKIDEWVAKTLETLGFEMGKLGLEDSEHPAAQSALARALIYAGCVLVFEQMGEDGKDSREIVNGIVDTFFTELT
jgi:hypothetical protein